jgi:hypothetical protein
MISGRATAVGRGQGDPRSATHVLRTVAIGHYRFQPFSIHPAEPDLDMPPVGILYTKQK